MDPAAKLLKEITLIGSIEECINLLWIEQTWYESYLTDTLHDHSISIGEWEEIDGVKHRNISSFHPTHVYFPGLPSHAESIKIQYLSNKILENGSKEYVIRETTDLKGIPYAEYFSVIFTWIVAETTTQKGKIACRVKMYLDIKFHQYTWIQSSIESSTTAQIVEVCEQWSRTASDYMQEQRQRVSRIASFGSNTTDNNQGNAEVDIDEESYFDCNQGEMPQFILAESLETSAILKRKLNQVTAARAREICLAEETIRELEMQLKIHKLENRANSRSASNANFQQEKTLLDSSAIDQISELRRGIEELELQVTDLKYKLKTKTDELVDTNEKNMELNFALVKSKEECRFFRNASLGRNGTRGRRPVVARSGGGGGAGNTVSYSSSTSGFDDFISGVFSGGGNSSSSSTSEQPLAVTSGSAAAVAGTGDVRVADDSLDFVVHLHARNEELEKVFAAAAKENQLLITEKYAFQASFDEMKRQNKELSEEIATIKLELCNAVDRTAELESGLSAAVLHSEMIKVDMQNSLDNLTAENAKQASIISQLNIIVDDQKCETDLLRCNIENYGFAEI